MNKVDFLLDPHEAPGTAYTAARQAAKAIPELLERVRANPTPANLRRLFAAHHPTVKMEEVITDQQQRRYKLHDYQWNPDTEEFTIRGYLWKGYWSNRLSKIEWMRYE